MNNKDNPVKILQEKLTAVGINKSVADVIGCKFVFTSLDNRVIVAGTITSINSDVNRGLGLIISSPEFYNLDISHIVLRKDCEFSMLHTKGLTTFKGTLVFL